MFHNGVDKVDKSLPMFFPHFLKKKKEKVNQSATEDKNRRKESLTGEKGTIWFSINSRQYSSCIHQKSSDVCCTFVRPSSTFAFLPHSCSTGVLLNTLP